MYVPSAEKMMELGSRLAQKARKGTIFRICGPLGAGKTTLVRGFLRGLGYEGEVRSPTFNIIHEYPTNPPVCHVDFYRLEKPEEILNLSLEDYLQTHVVLIEWAEKAPEGLFENGVKIEIDFHNTGREVKITPTENEK